MPSPNFEQQVEELGTNLAKIGDQIKSAAEETNKQIKASGEMHAETRDKVDKLLLEQGALQSRLQEAEQKLLKGPESREEEYEMSIGERTRAPDGLEFEVDWGGSGWRASIGERFILTLTLQKFFLELLGHSA